LLLACACEGTLPPLREVAEVGQDPIVVFVGGTGDAGGDLFAARTGGGEVVQLTYSPVGEMRPSLAPDGGAVAFLRGGSLTDSAPAAVWVKNLLNGAERQVSLPKGAGAPARVGWARDGGSLVVETGEGIYHAPAPPAEGTAVPVRADGRAAAESALAVLVGSPAFASVVTCADPANLCVVGDTGAPALLAAGARDAARWGSDSVAYFQDGELLVRPLGPGRARRVGLTGGPTEPRQPTVFAGGRGR
jgi:hypothetical protein